MRSTRAFVGGRGGKKREGRFAGARSKSDGMVQLPAGASVERIVQVGTTLLLTSAIVIVSRSRRAVGAEPAEPPYTPLRGAAHRTASPYELCALVRIQAWWRGLLARLRLRGYQMSLAAALIQACWRGAIVRLSLARDKASQS